MAAGFSYWPWKDINDTTSDRQFKRQVLRIQHKLPASLVLIHFQTVNTCIILKVVIRIKLSY